MPQPTISQMFKLRLLCCGINVRHQWLHTCFNGRCIFVRLGSYRGCQAFAYPSLRTSYPEQAWLTRDGYNPCQFQQQQQQVTQFQSIKSGIC